MRRTQHGTTAQYTAHRKAGEKPCDACLAANAKYVAQWRAATGDRRGREYRRARVRAVERLVQTHRAEFADILASELESAAQEVAA